MVYYRFIRIEKWGTENCQLFMNVALTIQMMNLKFKPQ